MKLTYRGQAYEISAQVEAKPPTSSKLIYRGHSYSPRPVAPELLSAGSTVTLIYRGTTYERLLPVRPYQAPRAINWRYQMPRES